MKLYALIQAGVVYNIIETDDSGWPDGIDISDTVPRPSIGWTYSEEAGFSPPAPVDEPAPPDSDPAPEQRIITNLAFDRRFTLAERTAIELASTDNPTADMEPRTQAAALRVIQELARKALFVDLDDAEVQSGVVYMEQAGLLAPERAIEILTAPVQPGERPGNTPWAGTGEPA